MSEIVDIIHRLSFELNGSEKLANVTNELKKQVGTYVELDKQAKLYERNIREAAKDDIALQQKLQAELNRTKQSRDNVLNVIRQTIQAQPQMQAGIKQEIGLIERLSEKIETLNAKRRIATDKSQVQRYTQQIAAVQGELTALTSNQKGFLGGIFGGGQGSVGRQIGTGLAYGLGIGSGFGIVTQAASGLVDLLKDTEQVYREVEGIRIAFQRLNQPDLLNNLREATKGTLSDLELMKYAVQANNFDVPLEKIAGLFSFARQRARETGESVDYLVKSIIIGIGRESPKILDNLGINVHRVREEFNRTGDYATAVFNIINEQGLQGAQTIETVADAIDRLNAKFENAQAKIGKEVAEVTLLSKAAIIDLINTITHPLDLDKSLLFGDTYLKAANEQIKLSHELAASEQKIADQANNIYLEKFDKFYKDFVKADAKGRGEIIVQAKDMYDELLRLANLGILNLQAVNTAYLGTFKPKTESKFSITGKTKTPIYQLIGFTEEELRDAKKSVDQFRLGLAATQYKEIGEANTYEDEIDRLLAIISGRKIKPIKSGKPSAFKKLKKEAEEADPAMKQIVFDLEAAVKAMQELDDHKFKLPGGIGTEEQLNRSLEEVRKGGSKYKIEKFFFGDTADKTDPEERRREEIEKSIKAYQSLAEAAVNSLNTIYDAQLRNLDAEIRVREKRVDVALKLAERGNTEALKIEQKRLDETIKKREEFARRQQVINAALAVSEAILAIATAAGESGAGAVVVVPAVLAAIIAGYAAISSATTDSQGSFAEGVVGFKGKGGKRDDKNVVRISSGESVITADATEKNRPLLEMMNKGADITRIMGAMTVVNNNGYATQMETKRIEKKLDGVIDAIGQNKTIVKNQIDAAGFLSSVERQNNLWKG